MFCWLQTHDRGDFVAALWLSSRCLHTSLLSSALPYLRVVDKTPPLAPRCALRLPFLHFTASFFSSPSGSGTVTSLFCYLIAALSAFTRVLFFLVLPGPNRRQSFPQKPSIHSFHMSYIHKNTPPNPPTHIPPGPAVTYYNDTYTMPSRLVSTLHSYRIALHLASYTYHRHPHHPS